MSSDDYALQIAQKNRLAITIAILNTKPENLSIEEYINQIKLNIDEKMVDDLNISVCSDDFMIDNTDDFNDHNYQSYMNQNRLPYNPNDATNIDENNYHNDETEFSVNAAEVNDTRTLGIGNVRHENNVHTNEIEILVNATQVNYNETQMNDNRTQDNGNVRRDLNESITMLHNFDEAIEIDVNKDRRDKLREVIQVLKGVDVTTDKVIRTEIHQQTCGSAQNELFDPMDTDLTQCFDDNYNTFFESIDLLTNTDRIMGYEHSYSQKKFKNRPDIAFKQDINTKINKRLIQTEEMAVSKPKIAKIILPEKHSKTNPSQVAIERNANTNQAVPNDKISNDASNNNLQVPSFIEPNQAAIVKVNLDTQETLVYSEYMQSDTHYSQSQREITIDNKLIYGSKPNNYHQKTTEIDKTAAKINNDAEFNLFSQNSQDIFNKSQNFRANNKNIRENDIAYSLNAQNMNVYSNNKPQATKKDKENDTEFSSVMHNTSDYSNNDTYTPRANNCIENDIAFTQNAQEMDEYLIDKTLKSTNMNNKNTEHTTFVNDLKTHVNGKDYTVSDKTLVNSNDKNKDCTVFDETTDKTDSCTNIEGNIAGLEDLTDTQIEKIPFKIIEEMNQIKMYLNKRKDIRMDSSSSNVYKSSQSRCSFKSTQPTSVRIGESANSVFNYLTNCSLVTTTQDLTEQISEVLGQLIDRLHEEETYPPFLEELLSTVHDLLKHVYEGESYGVDVLVIKDEQIQRIILLNKSTHIQKFTIEKINNVLQKFLEEISGNDTLYEIQNLNKIENICYIFNVLQVLIPKYSKNNSSQSTQNSQDEKVLRKKDISDLWRKKWIPNFKETSIEGICENKCVLKDCCAILNKLIVNCMEGYSLIAFCALKCFNMMQS